MVDTEYVLEQMRAANPAPSLEQLAVDDLDLVRNIVARERSATTTPVTEPPQTRPDLVSPRRELRPVLVAGLAFILVLGTLGTTVLLFRGGDGEPTGPEPTIAAGSTCPPDSSDFINATFDPGTGQALILAGGDFCMFDVRTNTWTAAPQPEAISRVTDPDLVYDVDSDRAIAFAGSRALGVRVWAYGPDGQGWTRMSNHAVDPVSPAAVQAVYDPVTGLVVVRAATSQMWTYDVDTDTWTDVDQGTTLPPAADYRDAQLLTYDASVDRLILYDNHLELYNTWEFDIRAGRWEKQATNTPHLGWGWLPTAHEFVYDEANQVSVMYSGDNRQPYVVSYDASEHSWTELWPIQPLPIPGVDPSREVVPGSAMTYDPGTERLLVLGSPNWTESDGVFAFDVATREWIILLEPTVE